LLAFSEDSGLLASGSYGRTAKVWDVANGNLLHVLEPLDSQARVLALSEDCRYLTTSTDKDICVWELESGKLLERQGRDAGSTGPE
jgi:WD40 repeat protein